MQIANVEGDEVLMKVCTSITKAKYYVVLNSGAKKELGFMYYTKGRFDRYKVISKYASLGKILNKDYKIEAEYICDDFNLACIRLAKLMRKITYAAKNQYGEDIFCQLWLGSPNNFRYKSAVRQPYKGNRGEKPAIYPALKEYAINVYGAKTMDGYEGDDALGVHKRLMVHMDKDIGQIPGDHYNFVTNVFYMVDEWGELYLTKDGKELKGTGLLFFYAQMLMGDRVDNIPSVPHPRYKGYGARTTYDALKGCTNEEQALNIVLDIYKSVWPYEWLDRVKEQADLTWICREEGQYGRDYIKAQILEYL